MLHTKYSAIKIHFILDLNQNIFSIYIMTNNKLINKSDYKKYISHDQITL